MSQAFLTDVIATLIHNIILTTARTCLVCCVDILCGNHYGFAEAKIRSCILMTVQHVLPPEMSSSFVYYIHNSVAYYSINRHIPE